MPMGPGKYDDEATWVREQTGAHTVLVLVVGGEKGQGFSMQTVDPLMMVKVPEMLRTVAAQIEAG